MPATPLPLKNTPKGSWRAQFQHHQCTLHLDESADTAVCDHCRFNNETTFHFIAHRHCQQSATCGRPTKALHQALPSRVVATTWCPATPYGTNLSHSINNKTVLTEPIHHFHCTATEQHALQHLFWHTHHPQLLRRSHVGSAAGAANMHQLATTKPETTQTVHQGYRAGSP